MFSERSFTATKVHQFRSQPGTAIETPTSGQVNRQGFALENAETSSIGRALQNAGIATKDSDLRPEEIARMNRVEMNGESERRQPIPLRSPASADERCEATARQLVSAESSQPQGTIIPNQLEWLKDRLGANLDAASEERFGRPARMLSLQEASDWIKELGKSKPATPATTQNAPGFHFEGAVIAKTMADLVTPKQIVAIRAIANAAGLNAETVCLETCKCQVEELSRGAASAFIDSLKSKTAEAK
jgi:hypothetical protein